MFKSYLALVGASQALKVGVFSDAHMMDNYNPASHLHSCGRNGVSESRFDQFKKHLSSFLNL